MIDLNAVRKGPDHSRAGLSGLIAAGRHAPTGLLAVSSAASGLGMAFTMPIPILMTV